MGRDLTSNQPAGNFPVGRLDNVEIREVVESWAVARDTGDWKRLLSAWHEGGTIVTTWFQGAARDFVTASQTSWESGARAFHTLGGCTIDILGDRALAQTRMSINVRGYVGEDEVDVTSAGRFYDFFERRNDRWLIVHRRAFYDRDRLDPVIPGTVVQLDARVLAQWPEGYRHLAYIQSAAGAQPPTDLPGLRGPAAERLLEEGARWLQG